MKNRLIFVALGLLAAAQPAYSQRFATEDPILRRIWAIGIDSSRTYPLAQALLDSIGPRLTSTPGHRAAGEWVLKQYRSWGIEARNEQYGTWRNWTRGYTHVDLIAPRVRTLDATLLAWSAGTAGPVTAPVVILPDLADSAALVNWASSAKGKFVAISYAEPVCRPDRQIDQFALSANAQRFKTDRDTARAVWSRRITALGGNNRIRTRLEAAGALGILQSNWSRDFGVNKIFSANTETTPSVDLSCEDYGLVYRLAQNNQGPTLRIDAQGTFNGTAPLMNTIATIKGSEKPNEYVMLSAHFDSWDGASGATDNGTGTIVMMEAMRILKQVLPNPKRTIMVGHWTSEEQGLNGSRAFVKDHPEVVAGLQALFNQDNGTGRIVEIDASGLLGAGESLVRWIARVPAEITDSIRLQFPGNPSSGGTDYASFVCAGAPAFNLTSLDWGYSLNTWHTNRDTFDKIIFEELKRNAVLVAMLAYQASEDPQFTSRERRTVLAAGGGRRGRTAAATTRTTAAPTWPACRDGQRSPAEATLGR